MYLHPFARQLIFPVALLPEIFVDLIIQISDTMFTFWGLKGVFDVTMGVETRFQHVNTFQPQKIIKRFYITQV